MKRPFLTLLAIGLASATSALCAPFNATYFGGALGLEEITAVAYADADVYIVGWTNAGGLPGVAGGAQELPASAEHDVFVARLSADLSVILQSTYFGGIYDDAPTGIAVTPEAVFITGWTRSTELPQTEGSAQPSPLPSPPAGPDGPMEGFVSRLSRDLRSIERTSFLGGDSEDYALDIAAGAGGIFVTGGTFSSDLASPGSAQPAAAGGRDAFVARFDPQLKSRHCTYLAGPGWDLGLAVALSGDAVYVTGQTDSPDLPHSSGGAQERLADPPPGSSSTDDAFVARLDFDLEIRQTTFLGGTHNDYGESLAVSPAGHVYVAGMTRSKNLPFTEHGAQPFHTHPSDYLRPDAFVARLNPELTAVHQATYLGGSEYERLGNVLVDSRRVLVAGLTTSQDFPGTSGGVMDYDPPASGGFVASLELDLQSIIQSTYISGVAAVFSPLTASLDPVSGEFRELLFAGAAYWASVGNTAGGAQPAPAGGGDGFVVRMPPELQP